MELDEWLWRKKITKRKMAAALQIHHQTLFATQKKEKTPTLYTALGIQKYTDGEVTLAELLSEKDLKRYNEIIIYNYKHSEDST